MKWGETGRLLAYTMHEQECGALSRPWGAGGGPRGGFQVQGSDPAQEGRTPQSQILTKDVSWEKHQDAHDEGPQPVQSKVPVPLPGWGMKG